jgi:site-specific recombinase XerD
MTALAPLLTAFLREHLPRERNASPHTIATYAHAFALLVRFAAGRLKRRPSDLTVEEIDPDLVLAFLDHVEEERGNAARSRNARFAAIRSFFRYLEYKAPACLEQALRIRALPMKRTDKALIDYLTLEEIKELLSAPDPRSWGGVRDRAMLHLTYAAGLRVSELLSLRLDDFSGRSLSMVRILGKGRRERVLPLWRETQAALRAWIVVRPRAYEPGRLCASVGIACCYRRPETADVVEQTGHAACAPPQLRHAHARRDRRCPQGVVMARSCKLAKHGSLSTRGSRRQAGRASGTRTASHQAGPLSAAVR